MKRFVGKVALIAGGTYGIGFAVAKRIAEEGAKVMICGRKEEHLKVALDQFQKWNLDVQGSQCHIGNRSDCTRLIDETIENYGKLDILVPNAAVNPTPAITRVLECPESAWNKIFDVNVNASFILAKEALPHLRKQSPGSNIVFISSISGLNPQEMAGAYSVSKTAVIGLAKVAAKGLAKEGIRVNCVAPGLVRTPFAEQVMESDGHHVLPGIPMGRYGTPEEIASVVAFLASDDASYITSETIVAAGGWTSRL